jgi:hypothetical protein
MSEELKPRTIKNCPFCKGECEISTKGNDYTRTRSTTIKCKKCHVKRTIAAIRNDVDWCIDTSIAMWNARPDNALIDTLVEALAELVALKSLKEKTLGLPEEYLRRKPIAWESAKQALAEAKKWRENA